MEFVARAAILQFQSYQNFLVNFIINSNQDRSKILIDFQQIMVDYCCYGSTIFVQSNEWKIACEGMDSLFSKNRTETSSFIPVNSGSEARIVRKSERVDNALICISRSRVISNTIQFCGYDPANGNHSCEMSCA